MSFPRYPKYKASGVEWLGEVPEHWTAGRLRRFARRYSGGTPDKTNLAYWQDGVIPWLNSGAVNDRLISEPSTFITAEAFSNSSAKWVPEGALVMALAGQGKTKGMVAQLAIPSTCNQSMAAIVPNPKLHARFLLWWLDSNYQSIRNLAGGDLRDGLNLELVGDIPLPVLPLPEQTAIAEFLDRETGKIDELVAEQRRLMELLKEKRQAVISHAVTKGLNPHAPMKPSGIEWLGDVPEHWVVCSPKRRIKAAAGGTLIKGSCSDEPSAGLFPGFSASGQNVWLEEYNYDCSAIVLSAVGARCGKTFKADGKWGVVANTHCLFPLRDSDRDYLWYLTNQEDWWEKGGSAQPFVKVSETLARPWVFPPLSEQIAIADFLETELLKFDALTAEAQRAINLLQERRTALISAAVTGQIDVRPHPKN